MLRQLVYHCQEGSIQKKELVHASFASQITALRDPPFAVLKYCEGADGWAMRTELEDLFLS
jgi:hypothetical protein